MEELHDQSGPDAFVIGFNIIFDVLNDQLVHVDRPDRIAPLTSVAARCLLQFVNSPRTVLRRQQLFDDGWRRYGMEVGDNSLNQVVHVMREAFHVVDPGKVYIKTLPRIGYVLVTDAHPLKRKTHHRAI